MKLADIQVLEVLDSRANPTVRVKVRTESGFEGCATVPSGASTGVGEALELRDGAVDKSLSGWAAKRVQTAARKALFAFDAVRGMAVTDQAAIDAALRKIDGTENFTSIGANAALGISLACARAAANALQMPLHRYLCGLFGAAPTPMLNVLNGGAHADNNVSIQEFMLVPTGFASFAEKLFAACEIYATLKDILKKAGHPTALGDEGGFAPNLASDEAALDLLVQAIAAAGYEGRVQIALDVAASELYADGKYKINDRELSSAELVDFYAALCEKYPIISIEDGCAELDYEGWKALNARLGGQIMLVGDDLFVTNTRLLARGIAEGWANAILIKPNQIGTLSDTIAAIKMAHDAGMRAVMSHRSGESEDAFIADFSLACEFIKTGAPARGERTAKYNRLLEIEAGM